MSRLFKLLGESFWRRRGRGGFEDGATDKQKIAAGEFRHRSADAPCDAFGLLDGFEHADNPLQIEVGQAADLAVLGVDEREGFAVLAEPAGDVMQSSSLAESELCEVDFGL